MAKLFETEVCGRCGGTGHYSYNMMNGTVCFGCGGAKVRLTKRGAAAQARFRAALAIKAEDVVVGMRIKDDGPMGAGTFTVAEITECAPTKGRSLRDGVMVDWTQSMRDFKSVSGKVRGYSGSCVFQRVPSAEERAALAAECLAFQATLGKNGKPLSAAALKRQAAEAERLAKAGAEAAEDDDDIVVIEPFGD